MSRLVEELPINEEPYPPFDEPPRRARTDVGNFIWLAMHQVFLRIGWIFKTESIVMPMFLSLVGGSSAMIGWLPVFNRLGFSVPPLLYAQRLKLAPYKRRMVLLTSLAMAAPFALLSVVWFSGVWREGGRPATWMPYFFLAVYAAFFVITGMNQLGVHTLQGKLIRYNLRGRMFSASVLVGAPLAVLSAWMLLPGWLKMPDGGFGWIFGFIALAFVASGLTILFTHEKPDAYQEVKTKPLTKFHDAWRVVREPRARPIAILSALVAMNFMLFPHYQSLYPRPVGTGPLDNLGQMMTWVCVQNAATALFSLIAGPLADRLGNRAALRWVVAGLALGPLLSIVLAQLDPETARRWFWVIFVPLGFMPVTIRLLINYTLEAAPQDDHPRYVAAIGMSIAAPVILVSPLVGYLAGRVGCVPVFVGGLVVLLLAVGQTFRLPEPRDARPGASDAG
jgi:MFS family permease